MSKNIEEVVDELASRDSYSLFNLLFPKAHAQAEAEGSEPRPATKLIDYLPYKLRELLSSVGVSSTFFLLYISVKTQ